jgi:predicted glycosyltransferase
VDDDFLVKVRDELYKGSWEKMLSDLEERLTKKSITKKFEAVLKNDIKRIKEILKSDG